MGLPGVRGAFVLCSQHTDDSKSKVNIRRYSCRGGILPEHMEKERAGLLRLCSLRLAVPVAVSRSSLLGWKDKRSHKVLLLSLPLGSFILSEPGRSLRLTFFFPLDVFVDFSELIHSLPPTATPFLS